MLKMKLLDSVTVNVVASKGSNEVVKYYYSKDDGATYVESTESSYTFTGLADTAEYKIKIKVEDSDGKFSTVYSESINTVTYILSSITTVTPTTKYNQITVATTAIGGTNSVSKYYYSINNGFYVEDGTSHTFTGLTEQTTYTIKVKVVDTNGRESIEYSTSVKTDAYKLPMVTIASTSSTYNSITINVTSTNGDGTITEYYYSKDNGSNYTKATTNTYAFTNLTSDATFNVKVYVKDSNGRSSSEVATTIKTTLPTLSDTCSNGSNLATCIKTYYTSYGTDITSIYYHGSTLANGANDNSYRYAGSSDTTNNFVCFGSDATTCPDDNLYRIIGVFGDQVKLIKWDYATTALLGTDGDSNGACSSNSNCVDGINNGYYKGSNTAANIGAYNWNYANKSATYSATNYYNVWSYSKLNTVNLNKNYINNIGTTWANKIASTTWKVGGNTWSYIAETNAKTAYTNEITSPVTINGTTTESSKIGLMYVSDYYYGASPIYWTYPGYSSSGASYDYRAATGENWMYMGLREWTVVRVSGNTNGAFNVYYAGNVVYQTCPIIYIIRQI